MDLVSQLASCYTLPALQCITQWSPQRFLTSCQPIYKAGLEALVSIIFLSAHRVCLLIYLAYRQDIGPKPQQIEQEATKSIEIVYLACQSRSWHSFRSRMNHHHCTRELYKRLFFSALQADGVGRCMACRARQRAAEECMFAKNRPHSHAFQGLNGKTLNSEMLSQPWYTCLHRSLMYNAPELVILHASSMHLNRRYVCQVLHSVDTIQM